MPARISNTMNNIERIRILSKLAAFLNNGNEELTAIIEKAYQHNKWFTKENTTAALKGICNQFLDEKKLTAWLSNYNIDKSHSPVVVGMVMAGNIPLVGYHDFLCVFLSGNKALIKLSSKDDVLFPFILKKLFEIEPELKHWISITDILKGMDAVIATGSDNSSRYFNYYFGKYPHIIRKNRNGVAVISGNETQADLENLGADIFTYFGLGCRNVSKLLVPRDYNFNFFFECMETFSDVRNHNKYQNNFDYNRTLLSMKHAQHLLNDFLIIKEEARVSSPVSMLHYEFYNDEKHLEEILDRDAEKIQCIVGENFIPFGKAQSPQLNDYADNIDTMEFLAGLK
jgi:hypothetical protein